MTTLPDKWYIIRFFYPRLNEAGQVAAYFTDNDGDFFIDDHITAAAPFKKQEDAEHFCQELIDAKLDKFLIKSSRQALFKFHLLGYSVQRVDASTINPFRKIFFIEDVKMAILECEKEGEAIASNVVITFPLEWNDWE